MKLRLLLFVSLIVIASSAFADLITPNTGTLINDPYSEHQNSPGNRLGVNRRGGFRDNRHRPTVRPTLGRDDGADGQANGYAGSGSGASAGGPSTFGDPGDIATTNLALGALGQGNDVFGAGGVTPSGLATDGDPFTSIGFPGAPHHDPQDNDGGTLGGTSVGLPGGTSDNSGNGVTAGVEITATTPLVPIQPVPEPSSILLLGTGLAGAAGAVRRKLKK